MRKRPHATIAALLLSLVMVPLVPSAAHANQDEAAPLDVCLLARSTEGIENSYVYRVLDLALSSQNRPYTLSAKGLPASQLRRIETVRTSDKQYVINLGSSRENETMLRPIYIPVYLGLDLRQRLVLTRKSLTDELKNVKTQEDLKRFTFGQGLGWADVAILEKAGLRVFTAYTKDSLMRMLTIGRIDLFPRGLFEAVREYDHNKSAFPDIVIDDHLVLTYPIASFFFVKKGHTILHQAIRTGLEKAYASGRMQDLFMTDTLHQKTLRRIRLDKRTHISIPVPDTTRATINALKRFPFIPNKQLGAPAR